MSLVRATLPYLGDDLLLLADLDEELRAHGLSQQSLLLRASETEKLARILAHGSDRGGYPGNRRWRHDPSIAHEAVILATSPAHNRSAHGDPERSSSIKKLALIEAPLLLVYAQAGLEQLRGNHYRFVDPDHRLDCLLAVFEVPKVPLPTGWFRPEEGHAYRRLAERALRDPHRCGRLVEVGCWLGRSTSYLAGLCRARAIELTCVDHWAGSSDRFDAAYRERLAAHPIESQFRRHLAALACPATIERRPSLDQAARTPARSVDLVFLDGSHDEAAVRAELAAWRPALRPGGLLAGHDYAKDHPGVIAAVDAAAREGQHRLERGPGSLWCLS